jgi:hypothetical protein
VREAAGEEVEGAVGRGALAVGVAEQAVVAQEGVEVVAREEGLGARVAREKAEVAEDAVGEARVATETAWVEEGGVGMVAWD